MRRPLAAPHRSTGTKAIAGGLMPGGRVKITLLVPLAIAPRRYTMPASRPAAAFRVPKGAWAQPFSSASVWNDARACEEVPTSSSGSNISSSPMHAVVPTLVASAMTNKAFRVEPRRRRSPVARQSGVIVVASLIDASWRRTFVAGCRLSRADQLDRQPILHDAQTRADRDHEIARGSADRLVRRRQLPMSPCVTVAAAST
jgi:hypothetical protein